MTTEPTRPPHATEAMPVAEVPAMAQHTKGPDHKPAHPLALGPVVSPPHTVDGFVREFLRELNYGEGVALSRSTTNDQYMALAKTVRHYLMADWLETARKRRERPSKMIGYLSAEYLLGRQLGNSLLATDLGDIAAKAMEVCGIDPAKLRQQEIEPGLGNGGLG
ncbi:MAG: glycogen phosphorylase, partial [Austwickia sp.]|nr:glycogen phosphorylase [Austwickia sp.]